jgi:hypothetical protein
MHAANDCIRPAANSPGSGHALILLHATNDKGNSNSHVGQAAANFFLANKSTIRFMFETKVEGKKKMPLSKCAKRKAKQLKSSSESDGKKRCF